MGRITQKITLLIVSISTAMLTSVLAFADKDTSVGSSRTLPEMRRAEGREELKPSLGVFSGFTDTQNNHLNSTAYGVEIGIQPYIPLSAALELSGYVTNSGPSRAALTRTKLMAKGSYNFGGDIPVIKDSYVGIGIGPVWDNINNKTDVEFGVAPQLGFDIPLGFAQGFSLGANANYMFVGGAKADVFALNGIAKYWF